MTFSDAFFSWRFKGKVAYFANNMGPDQTAGIWVD